MANFLVRYAKFAGTSVIGSIVDTLVLWLLSDFAFKGIYWGEYIVSPVISFECAVAVNFAISYYYVWKDRTVRHPEASIRRFHKLFWAYNLSCSAVFLIRLSVLNLIGKYTGWDVVICNLVAMCLSGIINFCINNLLIFRRKDL